MSSLWKVDLPVGENFALLRRQEEPSRIELLRGTIHRYQSLTRLADERASGRFGENRILVCIPYRQIVERGWAAREDNESIVVLEGDSFELLDPSSLDEFGESPPLDPENMTFDLSNDAYGDLVRSVIEDIAHGEGSSFVVSRSLCGRFARFGVSDAIAAFRRLVMQEPNAYWTFCVSFEGRVLIGASPERHVTVEDGIVSMTPISGTLRHADGRPTEIDLIAFLQDEKERNELNMVLDEELKMLGRLCELGGQVVGPALRPLTSVTHTEYEIRGCTRVSPERVLFETMLSPAVVGSPVENAARVIARRESWGRGYYTGVVGLIQPRPRWDFLDSCIAIRSVDVRPNGEFRLSVGASIVQGSVPESEAAETEAKASGIFSVLCGRALRAADSLEPIRTARVGEALRSRNSALSRFWFMDPAARAGPLRRPPAVRVVLVDAEDSFTLMLSCMLSALGVKTIIVSTKEIATEGVKVWFESRVVAVQPETEPTLLVLGPGPGNPADRCDDRIRVLEQLCMLSLRARRRFLAVCLSHQVLGQQLGLQLVRLRTPNQGVGKSISVDGRLYEVGFYNSYALLSDSNALETEVGLVKVHRDPESKQVYALQGPGFWSLQFHVESVLSMGGAEILSMVMADLIKGDDSCYVGGC